MTIDRSSIDALLETSKEDYERYSKENDSKKCEAYLKDAAEKLYAVTENLAELKTDKEVKDITSFNKAYREANLNISEYEKRELKRWINELHAFARRGIYEPWAIDEIETIYQDALEKIESVLKRSTEKRVRV